MVTIILLVVFLKKLKQVHVPEIVRLTQCQNSQGPVANIPPIIGKLTISKNRNFENFIDLECYNFHKVSGPREKVWIV